MIQTKSDTFRLSVALPIREGLLFSTRIAYEAYGEPGAGNVVVLLHDLLHSHRALGLPEPSRFQASGWGREVVGEGKLLPPPYFVLCPNLLGSPFGSTSPLTIDSSTGQPIGGTFPPLTVEDMSRAISGLLRGLRLTRLRALLGVGLGGMVALRLATLFPNLVGGLVVLGAAHTLPDEVRTHLACVDGAIRADPSYCEGVYPPGGGPQQTLRQLRMDYLRLLHAADASPPRAEDCLAGAQAFAETFDATAYAVLAGAYGECDLRPLLPRLACPALLVASSSDALAPPERVRQTCELITQAGGHAHFHELRTGGGHAALLKETQMFREQVAGFLSSLR